MAPREEQAQGDLVFMGPPGSGKGTQVRFLKEAHGWEHLATGDLFRDHLRLGTPLGRLAEEHMSKGHYVPDEVTVGMVRERLARIPASTRIVFDGFPRTVAQARALDELLQAITSATRARISSTPPTPSIRRRRPAFS